MQQNTVTDSRFTLKIDYSASSVELTKFLMFIMLSVF